MTDQTLDQPAAPSDDAVTADTPDASQGVNFEECRELINLEAEISDLAEKLAALRSQRETIAQRLVEQFAMTGTQNICMHGRTLYRQVDRYANAKKEFREEIVEWARENGLEDMIVMQPASFKSWCREQVDAGTFPPELADKVTFFEKVSLRVRKA